MDAHEDPPSAQPVEEHTASREAATETGNSTAENTPIVFYDHTGKRYIFPFESCKTYNTFKQLLEQTLARADDVTRNNVQQEKYDLLTISGEVILPAVWESVIKHHLPLQGNHGVHWYTVKISFWPSALPPKSEPGYETRGRSDLISRSRSRSSKEVRSYSRSRSPTPARHTSENVIEIASSTNSDLLSDVLTEDEDAQPPTPPPAASRPVLAITDLNGNRISYYYDTKWAASKHEPANRVGKGSADAAKSRHIRNMKAESPLKILKVLQVSTENRMGVQIHTLRGPENCSMSQDVSFEWYHLHGDQLDFSQFKEACLNVPGLSDRLKTLVVKTLEKIEKERLKAFLDGMFIEPGTVLRGDESDRDDALSVIFACIPNFEIQAPQKPSHGKSDRCHPPRTLMQTYYPYEPVRERDEEQAFKKFKSGSSSNNVIHLPSIWVMHIGTDAVVTCGYRPLTSDFVKSITIVQEDIQALARVPTSSSGEATNANLATIRLRDWDGRPLLFTIDECPTFFHIEQKLRELKHHATHVSSGAFNLVWTTRDGPRRISPRHWQNIIKCTKSMFIDISVLGEQTVPFIDEGNNNHPFNTASSQTSLPTIFQWPSPKYFKAEGVAEYEDETVQQVQHIPQESKRSIKFLEQVEKWMISETLDIIYDNDIEEAFNSTDYYQSLPEKEFEDVRSKFVFLLGNTTTFEKDTTNRTHHQIVVESQCSTLASETASLADIVHQTLSLFVDNVDKSPMLRKVFGALMNIFAIVEQVQKRGVCKSDEKEFTDPSWHPSLTGLRGWFIRNPKESFLKEKPTPIPLGEDIIANMKRCKYCRWNRRYHDAESAFEHVRQHAIHPDENTNSGTRFKNPKGSNTMPNLEDWIRNIDQIKVEETNAGCLAILTLANTNARFYLKEIKELVEGVTSTDGKLSSIYTLPPELLQTLRRLIVFYLSVERAFHFYEQSFQSIESDVRYRNAMIERPQLFMGNFAAVKRLGESVGITLSAARKDLCSMARSSPPIELEKRLSLGPEYLCCWLMRRLLVKPLDNSMTVADLYREYLSTLRFQANHHPSKRLLRDINLLREELSALEQINLWQTNLVVSYSRVLDDQTYPAAISSRRAFWPIEKILLESCYEHLVDALADYKEMNKRCGPLSELVKQSSEINDEDHGKAILVFTVVTIIFLPLSFVTSYLGMNTSDIRDMEDKQSLFWEIAIPLTVVTMGTIMFIAYNGEEIRGHSTAIYRKLTGKQETTTNAHGIGVAQRKQASKYPFGSSSTLVDFRSLADEAEFLPLRPTWKQPQYLVEQQFQSMMDTERQNEYLGPRPKLFTENAGYEPRGSTNIYRSQRPSGYVKVSPAPSLHPPPPPAPGQPRNTSADDPQHFNHIRIHKRHLDLDTLAAYNLPWEYDPQNPDYYVIFKPMQLWETDQLYSHTKNLREARRSSRRRSNRRGEEDDDYHPNPRNPESRRGYAWVRHKTRTGNRRMSPILDEMFF